jgi:hypothetical protein
LVKITYTPYSELVVHEVIEQDNGTFFEDIVRQALSNPVHAEPSINWVDGVAFLVNQMPPTEDVVKENLVGRVHLAAVIFTKIAYSTQVPVHIGTQEYSVRLRKADNNATFVDLVKFLKNFATKGQLR